MILKKKEVYHMQAAHHARGRRGWRSNRLPIIWHKSCITLSGRNEASDLGHSAAGSAHNAVRKVVERTLWVSRKPAL